MDAEFSAGAEAELVQLGHVEVAPELLVGDGGALWPLLGPSEQLDVRVPDEQLAMLPEAGWRLVHELDLPHGPQQTFAAARPDAGWALVSVSAGRAAPIVSADPGPVFVVAGRAARRAGLLLSWPAPITIARGESPELVVHLRNTARVGWSNQADDTAHVVVWVLDTEGEPVPGSSPWVVSTGRRPVADLDPDEAVVLPATVQVPLHELPPGHYRLEAVLTSLDLRSTPGTLNVQ